jgi:glutamate 5-kinase
MRLVAKIGTSSLTDDEGRIDAAMVAKVAAEVTRLNADGHQVIVVTSGAISAGLPPLGLHKRPTCLRCKRSPPSGSTG